MVAASWVPAADEHKHFTLANIPFGIISTSGSSPRVATAIGESVLDLAAVAKENLVSFDFDAETIFTQPTLNDFAALPYSTRRQARLSIQNLLSASASEGKNLSENSSLKAKVLLPANQVINHMPFKVGDYTDYSTAMCHNLGAGKAIFGEAAAKLPPGFNYFPLGYHGRSSSLVISGTDFKRPYGQFKDPTTGQIIYGASAWLDYELEFACFVSKATKLGDRVTMAEATEAIFGLAILNDWSARDIQGFEMMPLGPFQSKNFATSVTPWVVTLDALLPFHTEPLPQRLGPEPPHLQSLSDTKGYNIDATVHITPKNSNPSLVGKTNTREFYWSFEHMLVHQASSGCPLEVGDLLASGTCSGPTPDSLGCLLEATSCAKKPITLSADGAQRGFLEDGDTVTFEAWCDNGNARIGFGTCVGTVLPADPLRV